MNIKDGAQLMMKRINIKERLRSIKVAHNCYVETVWYVDITEYAVKIFGNIIKKAEVTLYYDEDDIEKAIKEAEEYLSNVEKDCHEKNKINFDTQKMLITFINEKQVELWSSEWGGIGVPLEISG